MIVIQKITDAGEETGKRELLYIAGEKITYSNFYGKKFGYFVKN